MSLKKPATSGKHRLLQNKLIYFSDLNICGSEWKSCKLNNEKQDLILWILGILFVLVLFLKCMKTHFYKVQTKTVCCLNFQLKFTDMLHGNSIKAKKEGYIFLFNKEPWKLHGVESLGNPLFLWKNVIGEIGDWHHNE